MVQKKTWKEFQDSGLLWFINTILHTFGWALVMEVSDEDEGYVCSVYPARVKFRGFDEGSNTKGYQKLSQYMKDNAVDLLKESME